MFSSRISCYRNSLRFSVRDVPFRKVVSNTEDKVVVYCFLKVELDVIIVTDA